MFSIPGKSPVTITPSAERQIARLMAAKSANGLRIGLKKGGCAGMEYTMELAEATQPGDEVVEQGEARVLIAPTAQMFSPMRRSILYLAAVRLVIADLLLVLSSRRALSFGRGPTGFPLRGPPTPMKRRL